MQLLLLYCVIFIITVYLYYMVYCAHVFIFVPISFLQATGSRLGTLVEISVAMFLSLAISLIYSWMLTLVLMGFIPVFIFAGFVQFRATTEGLKTSNAAMNVAGKVRWSLV